MSSAADPLRIAYLLEDTGIAGGVRVVAAQADALMARGHCVTIITKGSALSWRESRAEWKSVRSFHDADLSPYDFVIGTFWTTLPAAYSLAKERAIHLCQGYEGSFTAYQPMAAEIENAYRLPVPKIVVSPHLVEVCRRFGSDAAYAGQIVDDQFYREDCGDRRESQPLRVLLVGPAQSDFKGIDAGYAAVRQARLLGAELALIRVSQWSAAAGEPVELASEMHVALNTTEMAELVATCDVFLAPSRSQEGFGLPAAEAMASGLPGVLSEIPSFLSFDPRHDYALFAPEGDAAAMGAQLALLAGDRELRSRLARRGREVVEQFRAERTGERLEKYFLARRRDSSPGGLRTGASDRAHTVRSR